jgi:hypothetical protein
LGAAVPGAGPAPAGGAGAGLTRVAAGTLMSVPGVLIV